MSSHQGSMLPRGVTQVAAALLRTALAIAGVVMVIGLMVFAVMVAALLVVWALVRGRKPAPVRFAWRGFRQPGAFRAAESGRRSDPGEVLDVEARDITPWRQR